MAGSYPLYHLIKCKETPDDIDIFSYSLTFLRKILNFILENNCFANDGYRLGDVKMFEHPHITSYKIILHGKALNRWDINKLIRINLFMSHLFHGKALNRWDINKLIRINFIHIGKEDLYLSPETNKQKTMKFILEEFDIVASTTCYDGETLYFNERTLEKKSYYRLSKGYRLNKYRTKGFDLEPIPGLDPNASEREFYDENI